MAPLSVHFLVLHLVTTCLVYTHYWLLCLVDHALIIYYLTKIYDMYKNSALKVVQRLCEIFKSITRNP